MKGQSVKAAALSLTVHRLRDSIETANYLHECGHGISYADIQLLNTDWANWVTRNSSHNLPVQSFRKEKQYIHPLIILMENKTLTGAQWRNWERINSRWKKRVSEMKTKPLRNFMVHLRLERMCCHYLSYMKIRTLMIWWRWCLNTDLAWVLTGTVGHQNNPIASWLPCTREALFRRERREALFQKCAFVQTKFWGSNPISSSRRGEHRWFQSNN